MRVLWENPQTNQEIVVNFINKHGGITLLTDVITFYIKSFGSTQQAAYANLRSCYVKQTLFKIRINNKNYISTSNIKKEL